MGPLITAKNDEIDRWQTENAALFERIARLESDNSHLNTRVVELTESSTVKSLRIDDLLGEISELNESQRRENADHCGQVAKMDEKTKIRQSHFDNEQRRMRTGKFYSDLGWLLASIFVELKFIFLIKLNTNLRPSISRRS